MTEADPQTEAPALGWTHQRIADALDEVSEDALHRIRKRLEANLDAEMAAREENASRARLRLEKACGEIGHVWRTDFFRGRKVCAICTARQPESVGVKEENACSSAT